MRTKLNKFYGVLVQRLQILQERQKNMSLSNAIMLIVVIAVVTAGIAAGYYAQTIIYSQKLNDTWAIMYLESEHIAHVVEKKMLAVARSDRESAVFNLESSSLLRPVQGSITQPIKLNDLGLKSLGQIDLRLVEYAGEIYLMDQLNGRVTFKKVSRSLIAEALGRTRSGQSTVYVVTREGKLVYSNQSEITAVNFVGRPLVQSFIASPVSGSQIEFKTKAGEDYFGFFVEVPSTNLVIFSEAPKSSIVKILRQMMGRYILILIAIVVVVLALLIYPLMRMTRPLLELSRAAVYVGQGRYDVDLVEDSFGEIGALKQAFTRMLVSLAERDVQIKQLLVEQVEKTRLEAEVKIAQSIQNNLLPTGVLDASHGIEIAAEYIPADECAGDWYQYHYNAVAKETIVIIADVSGHGTGSSIFTALMAGIFDQFKQFEMAPWNLKEFIKQASGIIHRFGKGSWHATILIARYREEQQDLELISAGHNPAFYIDSGVAVQDSVRKIDLPSLFIGNSATVETKSVVIPFKKNDILIMYTDGFTEARDRANKQISTRKFEKELRLCKDRSAQQAVDHLLEFWDTHRQQRAAADDVCVIALRASA